MLLVGPVAMSLRSSALAWVVLFASATACADGAEDSGGSPGVGGSGGETSAGGGGQPNEGGAGASFTDGGGGASNGGAPEGGGGSNEGGGSGLDPTLFPPESEPNSTLASSDPLPAGALGFQGELTDDDLTDVFNVFVPAGSTLRAEITDGMGGCPPGALVRLSILDPGAVPIAARIDLCPRLDGNSDPDLDVLDEQGTYFVEVTSSQAVPFYVVEIAVSAPVCGDSITSVGEECDDGNTTNGDGCEDDCTVTPNCGDGSVQTGEGCDDGNTTAGDGCSDVCALEGAYCPEAESNDSILTATQITTCEGGVGRIDPAGDRDLFEVTVAAQGSGIRAQTTDLAGTSCPAIGTTKFNSRLALYDALGAQLGINDNGPTGVTPCSLINPTTHPFAANLAPGTYYVGVEETGNDAVSPQYAVLIDVVPGVCGDTIVQSSEQCDDGNLVDGDGCSSLCEVEGDYCAENEPNNAVGTATPITGCNGGSGAISPAGDRDFFRVEVTVVGSSITAETVDITGSGCPAGADTILRLYDGNGVQLGQDDSDGALNCSRIDPANDLFARDLPVGSYFVAVEDSGNNSTIPPYLVKVAVAPPGCGDGLVQAGEQCDDGNVIPGDGCDDDCDLEGNYCVESEPNDTFTQATELTVCDGGTGQINFIGDLDLFSFEVAEDGSSARIEIVDPTGGSCPAGFDSFIRVYRTSPSIVQLGTDDDDGNADCSLVNPFAFADGWASSLSAGTYYVRVEELGSDATSLPYVVLVTVTPPACGNGIIQTGEECDDGNTAPGDGCDDICEVEGNYCGETEPNASFATADDLGGCDGAFGRVSVVADQDVYAFTVTVDGSDLRAQITNVAGTDCPALSDTFLRLFDGAGTELGTDDNDGLGNCSSIQAAVDVFAADLAAGTYYLRVEETGNNATTGLYLLDVEITPPP